jgi:hypothetical protein
LPSSLIKGCAPVGTAVSGQAGHEKSDLKTLKLSLLP